MQWGVVAIVATSLVEADAGSGQAAVAGVRADSIGKGRAKLDREAVQRLVGGAVRWGGSGMERVVPSMRKGNEGSRAAGEDDGLDGVRPWCFQSGGRQLEIHMHCVVGEVYPAFFGTIQQPRIK